MSEEKRLGRPLAGWMILALAATAVLGLLPVVQLAAFAGALNAVVAGVPGQAVRVRVVILAASFLGQQLLQPWMPWLESQLQAHLSYRLQRRYFVRYGTVSYETLLRPEWAAQADRARQALPVSHRPFVLGVSVLQSVLTLTGYVVLLGHTAPVAALVVVATVGLIGVRQWVTGRRQSDLESALASTRVREAYYRQVLTSTELAAERSLFGYQPYILQLWKTTATHLYETRSRFTERAQRALLFWQWGQLLLVAGVYAAVVLFTSHDIGAVVVGFQVVDQVLGRSNALMLEVRLLGDGLYQLRQYRRFVTTSPAVPALPPSKALGLHVDQVAVDRVTYVYPEATRPALDHLSLVFPAGTVTGLVGPNGAGKSTLCALLAGLLTPREGMVCLNGQPVAPADLQTLVSVVYAPPTHFPTTLAENVALAGVMRPEAERLVQILGAVPDATVLAPDFRESVDLSGGQWQMLAIARATNAPGRPVLILDEPTAALDPTTEGRVLDELFELTAREQLVTILVSHRVSTVMRCDHVAVIDNGRVVQQGAPAALLGTTGLFQALYAQQVQLINRGARLVAD